MLTILEVDDLVELDERAAGRIVLPVQEEKIPFVADKPGRSQNLLSRLVNRRKFDLPPIDENMDFMFAFGSCT